MFYRDASGAPLYCPYPLSIAIPAMMIGHLSIAGLAEFIISAGVVAFLQQSDPVLSESYFRSGVDRRDRPHATALCDRSG